MNAPPQSSHMYLGPGSAGPSLGCCCRHAMQRLWGMQRDCSHKQVRDKQVISLKRESLKGWGSERRVLAGKQVIKHHVMA